MPYGPVWKKRGPLPACTHVLPVLVLNTCQMCRAFAARGEVTVKALFPTPA